MTVRVWQGMAHEEDVSVDDASVTLIYYADRSEDEAEIRAAAGAEIAPTYGTLVLQRYNLEHLGAGLWSIQAIYGPLAPLEPNTAVAANPEGSSDPTAPPGGTPPDIAARSLDGPYDGFGWRFSFAITGGQQKIFKSLGTTRYPSDSAPDTGGGIGATEDAVEGVDIQVPVFSFTAKKKFKVGVLPDNYLVRLYKYDAHVNERTVRIQHKGLKLVFEPGELKFDGGQVEDAAADELEVSLSFSCEYTAELKVKLLARAYAPGSGSGSGSGSGGDVFAEYTITKPGWSYIWFRHATSTNGNVMTRVTQFAYVEEVFPKADLRYLFC